MSTLLVLLYGVCFAAIAGGAIALMTQTLRSPVPTQVRRHLEAPEPDELVMTVDLSRERLERLWEESAG
jgi:hypothetical protein